MSVLGGVLGMIGVGFFVFLLALAILRGGEGFDR